MKIFILILVLILQIQTNPITRTKHNPSKRHHRCNCRCHKYKPYHYYQDPYERMTFDYMKDSLENEDSNNDDNSPVMIGNFQFMNQTNNNHYLTNVMNHYNPQKNVIHSYNNKQKKRKIKK